MSPAVRTERRFLVGRYVDHTPSEWHGVHILTWVRAPWGWMLFQIERAEAS